MVATERLIDPVGHATLPHIGALCRRIRASRDIDAAHMVRWCGVRHTSNITRNFEELGMTSDATFERYVQALQTKALVNPPLLERQAAILRALWRNRKQTGQLERNLAALSFEQIVPRQRSAGIAGCIAQLGQLGQPAFLMDDLWFVHALNGAMLRLFGIGTHHASFLGQWYGWHAVASAFCASSPLRQAYAYADLFLPPTIVGFLEDERTYPLLFTVQMRALIARTIELSEREGCEFQSWWRQATAFFLPYSLASLARSLLYQGRAISVEPRIHSTRTVALGSGYAARYALAIWKPVDRDALEAFEDIRQSPDSDAVVYAADYDRYHEFHVNDWPEARGEFEQWLRR